MKVAIIIGVLLILALITLGIVSGLAHYFYSKNVQSYYSLSVKSSTADKKLDYLIQYENKLLNYGLTSGSAAIIFKTPDNDAYHQYQVLLTIKERLEVISQMDMDSFEYQQALYELSRTELAGDESGTFGHINTNIFKERYFLQHNILAHCGFGALMFTILLLGLIGCGVWIFVKY